MLVGAFMTLRFSESMTASMIARPRKYSGTCAVPLLNMTGPSRMPEKEFPSRYFRYTCREMAAARARALTGG